MNPKLLTALGCSSSLALMLVTINTTNASNIVPESANVNFETMDKQTIVALTTNESQPYLLQNNSKEGEHLLDNLGCQCQNCQNSIRQMLQQSV